MSFTMYHRCILSAAVLGALTSPPANAANQQSIQVDIAPQTLDGALNQLAEATGLELSYPGALSAGLKSPGLAGRYTAEQALDKLLAGTGLAYRYTGARAITLERLAANSAESPAAGDAIALGKVTVSAEAEDDPSDPYSKAYTVPNATTATKTDTPIMETPMSIQVVPKQVLQDQQAYRIQDAVKNVSGVQQRFIGGGNDNFIVRGFDLGTFHYRDGVRIPSVNFDFANVQQVEVLKGPASTLYGRIEPGGLIVKFRKIVNPLAKEMGMGRLPVFERLNRGEMA